MSRRASIIVSSYNYARFLRRAIDGALAQSYPLTQVIVVDDGSTDDSPSIIREYRDRVVAVLKENGGQASSLNAGFARSTGDVVIFLDSDDVLEPDAVATAVALVSDDDVSKAHWPLRQIDVNGAAGKLVPASELPQGDLRQVVLDHGPRSDEYIWPPTSGNAFSRRFLEQVMPMPESAYRTCPDLYLCALAPLYGRVAATPRPLSHWRVHGENNTWKQSFLPRVRHYVKLWEETCADLERHARKLHLAPNPAQWRRESWWHRLERAATQLRDAIRAGEPFILIDDDQWACLDLDGRPAVPLIGQPGRSLGAPVDDEHALRELDARRAEGIRFLAVAWPAFWWLEHYSSFARHLRIHCRCVVDYEDVILFAV